METQGRKAALPLQLNNFSIPCRSPCPPLSEKETGFRPGEGFGVRVITVLWPAGARRRGAKSSPSLWRHSGIYLQRRRRSGAVAGHGERGGNEDFGLSRGCPGRAATRSFEFGVFRGALELPV